MPQHPEELPGHWDRGCRAQVAGSSLLSLSTPGNPKWECRRGSQLHAHFFKVWVQSPTLPRAQPRCSRRKWLPHPSSLCSADHWDLSLVSSNMPRLIKGMTQTSHKGFTHYLRNIFVACLLYHHTIYLL